eukprot:Gb_34596 [translate_table: standard]
MSSNTPLHASMSALQIDEMDKVKRGPEFDIVIAGGGLAGLALALGLQERKIEAHVFESHPYLRSDTATAIGIGPNGVTALEGIKPGLSTIVAEAGTYTNSIKFIMLRNGKEDEPRITEMAPKEYVTVRWKSVQQILGSLIDSTKITFSHKLIAYKPCKGGVEAYFRCPKQDAESLERIKVVRAKLLIGADGIWSAIRKQMVGDAPRYLKMVDWNAILYNPDLKLFDGIKKGEIVGRSEENAQTQSIIAHAGSAAVEEHSIRKGKGDGGATVAEKMMGRSMFDGNTDKGDGGEKENAGQRIRGREWGEDDGRAEERVTRVASSSI